MQTHLLYCYSYTRVAHATTRMQYLVPDKDGMSLPLTLTPYATQALGTMRLPATTHGGSGPLQTRSHTRQS